MIKENVPNEIYHNKEHYPAISSSDLKKILISPRTFKDSLTEKKETTPAMNFGSAFHDYNQSILETGFEWQFESEWNIFEHPRNPKTGEPVGKTTIAYANAYESAKIGKVGAISDFEYIELQHMHKSFEKHPATRLFVGKGKDVKFEQSYFVNDNGVEQKVRPDRETERYIFDVKTCKGGDSSIYEVSRIIDNFNYDLSAAMYQWLVYRETGIFKRFVWIFIENEYPYQVNYHYADDFAYKIRKLYNGGFEYEAKLGATRYKRAIEVYKKCVELDQWQGTDVFINNKFRVGTPQPRNYMILPEYTL